jgi:predicted anti-sigma-YlaC factor YlaD
MDCKSIEKKLIFYLEGDLPDEENKIISSHIKGCNQCAAKLQYIQESIQTIELEKSTVPKPFLFTRIQARMQSKENKIRRLILAPLAIASILTIGLFVGTLVGKSTINQWISHEEHNIAYLFNDEQIENMEISLLNN